MHANAMARLKGVSGRRIAFAFCLGVMAVLVVLGCRDEFASDIDTNIAPDTYLTGFPPESTTTIYRVHLYWYGNDPDGLVTGYEYAITDSMPGSDDTLTYKYTARTDSVFLMPVSSQTQVLGHRFYIRAIDNEGKKDPEPAWTFFSVADPGPPRPYFKRADVWVGSASNPTIIDTITSTNTRTPTDTLAAGTNVRFIWAGGDSDRVIEEDGSVVQVGSVTGYRYFLFPGQAEVLGGKNDTIAVYTNLQSGKYEFRLKAIDDAGFAGLDPAVRTFVWNKDPEVRFLTGTDPFGNQRPHVFAVSQGWGNEPREYFPGDTIPLIAASAFQVYRVDLCAPYEAEDPDDILGKGVKNFQFRDAAGSWRTGVDTLAKQVCLLQQVSRDVRLEVRCQDGYGRWDGSPPMMVFYINRAPGLVDTLGMFPRPNQAISLDSLAAWNWRLPVRVFASDPDGTTRTFEYAFRTAQFIYDNPVKPPAGQPATAQVEIDPRWRQPGEYKLGVRVTEQIPTNWGAKRQTRVDIPFRFVP